jgi:hypothetical protein
MTEETAASGGFKRVFARITQLEAALDQLEARLSQIEAKLDNLPQRKKRSGESPPGVCVVTGKPSEETCEYFSTYRYQQGCGGACVEQGRAYYRKYYYDNRK